jgi:hypothetical protein
MAGRKGATQRQKDRGPNSASVFLREEDRRAVLGNGNQMMPRPTFTQPDNGTHTHAPGTLGPHYDPTSRPMKVGNTETDLRAGLY